MIPWAIKSVEFAANDKRMLKDATLEKTSEISKTATHSLYCLLLFFLLLSILYMQPAERGLWRLCSKARAQVDIPG